MLLYYFLQAWRSTRKTILIFHDIRQVSPDFYLFHNFWKEKKSQVSPTRTIKHFGFWYKFHLFWKYEHLSLRIIMYLVKYKSVQSGVPKPGVFWVLTPLTFLGLQPPTFWRDLKMGAGEKFRS